MSDNQKSEQSLWENVHQASKIYILPNSFTAGNLFFGFLSIILCIQGKFNAASTDRTIDHIAALITPNYTAGADAQSTGYYVLAIICILASFMCDALDGRVARASGKTSLFGKEFDSLADSVSFGIAPCLLMYFLILQPSDILSETWARPTKEHRLANRIYIYVVRGNTACAVQRSDKPVHKRAREI